VQLKEEIKKMTNSRLKEEYAKAVKMKDVLGFNSRRLSQDYQLRENYIKAEMIRRGI
jgi:hypothetical protein